MSENKLFRLLENPIIYKAAQTILGPGAETCLRKRIRQITRLLPMKNNVLDVGCGPVSRLWHENINPIGVDLSFSYAKAFTDHEAGKMIVSSANLLPLSADTFSGVWTIGLLHHMNDEDVVQALNEMVRVCRPGGNIIVMDAVLPRSSWLRPIAYLIRKMDRGKFMRTQSQLTALLPDEANWSIKRFTYAATGLEMLECSYLN